jgi:hypothetical protein
MNCFPNAANSCRRAVIGYTIGSLYGNRRYGSGFGLMAKRREAAELIRLASICPISEDAATKPML